MAHYTVLTDEGSLFAVWSTSKERAAMKVAETLGFHPTSVEPAEEEALDLYQEELAEARTSGKPVLLPEA